MQLETVISNRYDCLYRAQSNSTVTLRLIYITYLLIIIHNPWINVLSSLLHMSVTICLIQHSTTAMQYWPVCPNPPLYYSSGHRMQQLDWWHVFPHAITWQIGLYWYSYTDYRYISALHQIHNSRAPSYLTNIVTQPPVHDRDFGPAAVLDTHNLDSNLGNELSLMLLRQPGTVCHRRCIGVFTMPMNWEKFRTWLKHTTLEKLPQWKITKIVATRLQILRLKCTKFDFGWGSAPDLAGELTALPQIS